MKISRARSKKHFKCLMRQYIQKTKTLKMGGWKANEIAEMDSRIKNGFLI